MTDVLIQSAPALRGEVELPGDKSISHRAVIFSSISEGRSRISNFLHGEDCLSTVNAMRAAGVEIEVDGTDVLVNGAGMGGLREPADIIDAGNSGTTTRLLAGLFAGQNFFTAMTGDDSLRKRPMKRVVGPLRLMGAEISGREGGDKLPLAIKGAPLKGIEYRSPVASAQVKSSVLLAGLTAEGRTTVHEPSLSRDHTERMLLAMGCRGGRNADGSFFVEGGSRLKAVDIEVPGDISSAAFLMVAGMVVKNSEITIRNVGVNPTRTGIIDVLRAMGGEIALENERLVAGEPVADILVRSSSLKGVEIGGDLIPRAIDEIPVIAVAAALADGVTKISGAQELRVKESDRIETVARELGKFGVRIEERADGLVIEGCEALTGASIETHGDHRIAMSMAVAGLRASGETRIKNADCVNVSFPGFFDLLEGLKR